MILRPQLVLSTAILGLAAFSGCFGGGDAGDAMPIANFTVTPKGDGVTFLFDATNSSDPQGGDLNVAWNFGDEGEQLGTLEEFGLIEYTYAVTNTMFWVSLVVTNSDGNSAADMKQVTLGDGNNSKPIVVLKNATRWVKPGGGVVLDASKSTDPNDDLFNYEWILGNFTEANESIMSPFLQRGQGFDSAFTTPGVYLFHCHPHPWMKMRVIVDGSDANATNLAEVDITNYAYSEKTVTVAPGGTVNWTNRDPDVHTATLEWFAPGKIVSTSPIFSAKLEGGDYQARLILNDGKGGINSTTWGLRASTDAPDSPLTKDTNYQVQAHLPPAQPWAGADHDYPVAWPGNLTFTVSYDDPADRSGLYRISLVKSGVVLTGCVVEAESCTGMFNVEPGNYRLRVSPGAGQFANSVYTVSTSTIQWSYPPFGDSMGCPPGYDNHGGVCMKH